MRAPRDSKGVEEGAQDTQRRLMVGRREESGGTRVGRSNGPIWESSAPIWKSSGNFHSDPVGSSEQLSSEQLSSKQ